MENEVSTKALNRAFYEKITSDNPEMVKDAPQGVNDFTRVKMREDGFWRKILPPVPISNDELDRQVDTEKNVKIVDKEPDSPAAISIPYATLPMNRYIQGPRYRVMFDRIVTPNFTTDVTRLRTWDMDIRQVLSDNAIKDMLAEEDGRAMQAVDASIGGAVDAVVPETGVIQWKSFSGGITRETFNDALKILPSTPSHLEVATVLINSVFVKDLQKWGRDEIGGDLSEEIARNGWAERVIFGVRTIVTIKRDLVEDGTMYMFAEPKFLGKFFVLEDTTMHIERKAYMLSFFSYEEIGSAIGNVAACARADFTGGNISGNDLWRY
jgi:hypothetical protein